MCLVKNVSVVPGPGRRVVKFASPGSVQAASPVELMKRNLTKIG